MRNQNYFTNFSFILTIGLIFLGIYYRLIPHPPNFSPLIPITVLSGFILARKYNPFIAFVIPLIILFSTDLILGFYKSILFVYISFFLSSVFSFIYSSFVNFEKKINTIIHANISSLINNIWFFIFSNFGVWLTTNMYSKNLKGLTECYIMAIPFLKNSLLASIIFTTLIFAIYYFVIERIEVSQENKV